MTRPRDFILDASVAAKCFFEEPGREEALAWVAESRLIYAPDLIFVEMASLASKKVRRGQIPEDLGRDAVLELGRLLAEATPAAHLAADGFDLAARHGVSAYDGLYLALAMQRELVVLTADVRLVRASERAGLSRFVRALAEG